MYYDAIQALFIIISWTTKRIVGTDPNYRAFSQHEHGYEYGYINMKAYPGKKLNMTAFKTTITSDVNQCAIDCFTSVTKQCQSLNIEQIQSGREYKCEMMELDKHKAYPHFVDAKSNATTHYDVSNHCSKPRPCPSHNHWCIPNHVTGEKQCQCKSNYTGTDCKSERNTTFRFKITRDTDNEPYMEKPIDASVSSDASVSFKYFVDVLESGSSNKVLASISIPPYCDPFKVFFSGGEGTINVAKVPYAFSPPAVMKWHHMVVIVDMSRSVVKIYSNGEFLMECPLIGYKDNSDIVTQLQVSLGGYLRPNCAKGSKTFSIRARYAEAYAWNRVLDDNDIPLLYKTKFIPYNPIIKWEEFRFQENKDVIRKDIDLNILMS